MPIKTVFEGRTESLAILSPEGQIDADLLPEISKELSVALYENMVKMRAFDDKALKMQRQGRMGTWASIKGQEAVQAGVGMAMGEQDWLLPTYRDNGLQLMKGVPGYLIYANWGGDERGSHIPEPIRCLPAAVPVGSQWLHGAGIGMALVYKNEDAAAVVLGGEGSSSEGDFYEALNFAGLFKAKTVFVVQNNQWAISVPREKQTAAKTIAQKAMAAGMDGIQVDGNDVFGVYTTTLNAIKKARKGDGPTLIEAVTYRLSDHTTADDALHYRKADEVKLWEKKDPILRARLYLDNNGLWDEQKEKQLVEKVSAWVDEQVNLYESMTEAPPEDILRFTYAEPLPPQIVEQIEELKKESKL